MSKQKTKKDWRFSGQKVVLSLFTHLIISFSFLCYDHQVLWGTTVHKANKTCFEIFCLCNCYKKKELNFKKM